MRALRRPNGGDLEARNLRRSRDQHTVHLVSMSELEDFLARASLRRGSLRGGKMAPRWSFEALCGRWVELSGHGCATLSAVAQLLVQAQQQGAPIAWVRLPQQSFYPPDLAAWGLSLSCMPVVCASDTRAVGRACEHLLRSGAFAVVVMDLVGGAAHRARAHLPMPLQGRLLRLAQRRKVLLLSLTRSHRDQPSLGTMVSLRAEVQGRFVSTSLPRIQDYLYQITVLKDKIHGPGWSFEQRIRGRFAELVTYPQVELRHGES